MSKRLLWAGLVAAAVALPSRSYAQSPSFQITPYAGYLKSGTLLNGPVGTSIRGGGAPVYGAEAALGLARGLYLVGNVAYSKPELELGAPVVGGLNVGESSVLLYDAALRLDVPLLPLPLISPVHSGRRRTDAPDDRRRAGRPPSPPTSPTTSAPASTWQSRPGWDCR